jgi:hypothetical protein
MTCTQHPATKRTIVGLQESTRCMAERSCAPKTGSQHPSCPQGDSFRRFCYSDEGAASAPETCCTCYMWQLLKKKTCIHSKKTTTTNRKRKTTTVLQFFEVCPRCEWTLSLLYYTRCDPWKYLNHLAHMHQSAALVTMRRARVHTHTVYDACTRIIHISCVHTICTRTQKTRTHTHTNTLSSSLTHTQTHTHQTHAQTVSLWLHYGTQK